MSRSFCHIALLCLLPIVAGCHHYDFDVADPVELHLLTAMPSPKASAAACTIGRQLYVFGGRNQDGKVDSILWCYDLDQDTWTAYPTPLKPRVKAIMQTDGEYLYLGLGYGEGRAYFDDKYFRDLWSYNPTTQIWEQLQTYPSMATVGAVSCIAGDNLYVLYGNYGDQTKECYTYSISQNQWSALQRNNNAGTGKGRIGGIVGNTVCLGLGYDGASVRAMYQTDLLSSTWETSHSLPGDGRVMAAATGTSEYLYVFGGRFFRGTLTGGKLYDEIWRFSPHENHWEYVTSMPEGRAENQIAFTLNGKAGFGLGEDIDGNLLKNIYLIEE